MKTTIECKDKDCTWTPSLHTHNEAVQHAKETGHQVRGHSDFRETPHREIEEIVEEFKHTNIYMSARVSGYGKKFEDYLRTTLLTHTNTVREEERDRIFGEIEQFKSEVATMDYCDDFKDGIYATIEHILAMQCFESVLTPTPSTEELVDKE